MAKKKATKPHDKHAPKKVKKKVKRAEPGSGIPHDKHAEKKAAAVVDNDDNETEEIEEENEEESEEE
jgi:hypothetical protein